MKTKWQVAVLSLALAMAMLGPNAAAPVGATIIHESAELGPTDRSYGGSATHYRFLGSRFSISQASSVIAIGGHFVALSGFRGGNIFGAIVGLSSPTAFPDFWAWQGGGDGQQQNGEMTGDKSADGRSRDGEQSGDKSADGKSQDGEQSGDKSADGQGQDGEQSGDKSADGRNRDGEQTSSGYLSGLHNLFARVRFVARLSDHDLLVPLSVTLPAGDYALIFVSDLFGDDGTAGMSTDDIDIADHDSYFYGTDEHRWTDGGFSGTRFVVDSAPVRSTAISEPWTLLSFGFGLIALGLMIGRRKTA